MLKRVRKVLYRLDLPSKLKLHLVSHVSMLKLFHVDEGDLDRRESQRAPLRAKISYDQDVECIIVDWIIWKKYRVSRREYLVQWRGIKESEASWEPSKTLWQFQKHIDAFHIEDTTRVLPD